MAQLTHLEALEGNAKNRNRSASAGAHSNLPKPAALNQDRNREILAVLPRLRRYARILTRDVAGADDLVQDWIARALKKIGLWEQGTDLCAWMFTVLYHQHISHTRRDARQRAFLELHKSDTRVTLSPDHTIGLETHASEITTELYQATIRGLRQEHISGSRVMRPISFILQRSWPWCSGAPVASRWHEQRIWSPLYARPS